MIMDVRIKKIEMCVEMRREYGCEIKYDGNRMDTKYEIVGRGYIV